MDALPELFVRYAVPIWLTVAVVFLLLELASMSGWLLWPAASAGVVALITRIWQLEPPIQVAIFAGLTAVNTYLGRRLMGQGPRETKDPNDPRARVIGLTGTTTTGFKDGLGRVFVDGKEWAAELEGKTELRKGARVYVVAVKGGARLKVRSGKP
jgi:membrane protein implicated in regulation of membrane protease activity